MPDRPLCPGSNQHIGTFTTRTTYKEHNDMVEVNIHTLLRDEGTIALFGATETESGEEVIIASDHRPAHYIALALGVGEHVVAQVEPWQVVGRG